MLLVDRQRTLALVECVERVVAVALNGCLGFNGML